MLASMVVIAELAAVILAVMLLNQFTTVELKLSLLPNALPNSSKVSNAAPAPPTSVPMLALNVCIAALAALTLELSVLMNIACAAALALLNVWNAPRLACIATTLALA